MKKNMGKTDTRMRVIAAFIVLMLFFFELISGTLAIILVSVAVVLLITSLLSYCPLYAILGLSTKRNRKRY